jgi:putative ABC transport system permease protein
MNDFRSAIRALRRSPGFTPAAVLTLALGIGATTTLFSVVHGVLLRPLPYPAAERLVRVYETDRAGGELSSVSPPNFMAARELDRVFAGVALYSGTTETLTGNGDVYELSGAEVSANLFDLLGVPPVLGRGFPARANQPGEDDVVVIGYGLWQRLFAGEEAILGRALTLHGRARSVVGVMPEGFDFPGGTELWVPTPYGERFAADHAGNRRSRYHNAVARLQPEVTLEQAQAEANLLSRRLELAFPAGNTGVGFAIVPLQTSVVGGMRAPLLVAFGAVGLVLLIACVSVAGLLLARAAARQRELAVRAALGATPGRLLRELLSESVILALLGGVLGVLGASWAVDTLVALQPEGLPRVEAIRLDRSVLVFALGVTCATALLAGLFPAVRAARGAQAGLLRGTSRGEAGSAGGARARAALVVAECALAVILLVGAGLLLRSLLALMSVDMGFRTEQVLAFRVSPPAAHYQSPEAIRDYYDRLLERVAGLPDVRGAAAVSRLPIRQSVFGYRIHVEGLPPPAAGEDREIRTRFVTPAYFRVMGIDVRQGRGIEAQDRGVRRVIVINEAAARHFFPGEDPIGRQIRAHSNEQVGGEVVGVVADARQDSIVETPLPEMYVPHTQFPARFMTVVVRAAGDPLGLAQPIVHELQALDRNVPLPEFSTMEQVMADAVARPRFLSAVMTGFAGTALVIAATGLFGLLSFSVARQRREIGIRMALGARQAEVIGRVLRRGLSLTAVGLATGIVGAMLLTRLLQSVLYGVSAVDPVTLLGVALLLGGTALLASYLPARQAARVDPLVALRDE